MSDRYCGGYAQPCLAAIAVVDSCTGVPVEGLNAYAFDGLRAVKWEPIIEEAETATFRDSCGNIVCENRKNCDQLIGYDIEMEKCTLPFELFALMTGQPIVTDTGETIGWYHSSEVDCQPRLALLIWEETLACTAATRFKKTIFPFTKFSFPTPGAENDILVFNTIKARADRGYLVGYGDGPFNDDTPLGWAALDPGITGAIGEYVTDDDPPVAQCGLIDVLPDEQPIINGDFLVLTQDSTDLSAHKVWSVADDASSDSVLSTLPEVGTNEIVPSVLGRSADRGLFAINAMSDGNSFGTIGGNCGNLWLVYDNTGVFVDSYTPPGDVGVGLAAYPGFNDDGTKIAFRQEGGDPGSIKSAVIGPDTIVNIQGANENDYRSPSWSPDGSQIAYFADGDNGKVVRVSTAAGSFVSESTSPIGSYDAFNRIMWTPDSAKIYFKTNSNNFNEQDAATGAFTTITTISAPWDLSPDGTTVVYVYPVGGGQYTINTYEIATDTDTTRTTNITGGIGFITYSPDGLFAAAGLYSGGNFNEVLVADLTASIPAAPSTHFLGGAGSADVTVQGIAWRGIPSMVG